MKRSFRSRVLVLAFLFQFGSLCEASSGMCPWAKFIPEDSRLHKLAHGPTTEAISTDLAKAIPRETFQNKMAPIKDLLSLTAYTQRFEEGAPVAIWIPETHRFAEPGTHLVQRKPDGWYLSEPQGGGEQKIEEVELSKWLKDGRVRTLSKPVDLIEAKGKFLDDLKNVKEEDRRAIGQMLLDFFVSANIPWKEVVVTETDGKAIFAGHVIVFPKAGGKDHYLVGRNGQVLKFANPVGLSYFLLGEGTPQEMLITAVGEKGNQFTIYVNGQRVEGATTSTQVTRSGTTTVKFKFEGKDYEFVVDRGIMMDEAEPLLIVDGKANGPFRWFDHNGQRMQTSAETPKPKGVFEGLTTELRNLSAQSADRQREIINEVLSRKMLYPGSFKPVVDATGTALFGNHLILEPNTDGHTHALLAENGKIVMINEPVQLAHFLQGRGTAQEQLITIATKKTSGKIYHEVYVNGRRLDDVKTISPGFLSLKKMTEVTFQIEGKAVKYTFGSNRSQPDQQPKLILDGHNSEPFRFYSSP